MADRDDSGADGAASEAGANEPEQSRAHRGEAKKAEQGHGSSGLQARVTQTTVYDLGMDPDHARELLHAERLRLERALIVREHQDDGEEADDQDPSNLGADLYQDELDEGLRQDLEERLEAVGRAEARLDAGTYGLSVESGEPIPDARLEVYPTAELTVEEERARGS
jgi:DnaK suppressor protein